MREAGAVCIAFALVAVIARGWGLSGLDGMPGIAPPWAYQFAAIYCAPIALMLFVVGLVIIL